MVGKILIVDDVATNRIVMKFKLHAAGYLPVLASSGHTCLTAVAQDVPDMILLDLLLSDISGIEVLRRLRADPALRSVPIIVFSSSQDPSARAQAFRAGADEFMPKPFDDQVLLARIRSFMRARTAIEGFGRHTDDMAVLGLAETAGHFRAPGLIALVTARAETALLLRRDLVGHLSDRVVTMTPDEALSTGLASGHPTSGNPPDVFLIEADLGGTVTGLQLMSELRSRLHTRHSGFSILTAAGSPIGAAMAFDLGANDWISASVSGDELASRLQRLMVRKHAQDAMRASVEDGLRLAMIDPLTGLHNRRYGLAQLGAIIDHSHKTDAAFAVMVVDLDRFKSINDRWGHAAGDAVLIEVAARLTQNLRVGDLLARIGGEEFLIALPDTDLSEAQAVAERLCQVVEQTAVLLADRASVHVTVSIGLAISTNACARAGEVAEMIDRADRALLVAKSGGRNQVTISRTAA